MDILKMDATDYWEDFMRRNRTQKTNFETWSFTNRPNSTDMLVEMVVRG